MVIGFYCRNHGISLVQLNYLSSSLESLDIARECASYPTLAADLPVYLVVDLVDDLAAEGLSSGVLHPVSNQLSRMMTVYAVLFACHHN